MSAFQSKLYRLETQLGEFHQQINDKIELDFQKRIDRPLECLTALENIIGQLSIDYKNHATLQPDKLVDLITKSRDDLRLAVDSSALDVFTCHLSHLSWLVSAKASIQTLAAALTVFSENVLLLNEEIRYWEDVLQLDWFIGLYAVQTSPFKAWRSCMESSRLDNKDNTPNRSTDDPTTGAKSNQNIWLRFYTSVQQFISPRLCSFRVGLSPSLTGSKLEIQRKRRKLKAMRDFNASAVGLLVEKCLSFEADTHLANSGGEPTNNDFCQTVRASVGLMKSLLRNTGDNNPILDPGNNLVAIGDRACRKAQYNAGNDVLDARGILDELVYILTNLLPKYRHLSAKDAKEFGRPSSVVRYWLPLSLGLVSATTSLKLARDIGPVLIDSVSNLGITAIGFWRNWVVGPTWKLVRTIRHDEKSDIALMSQNSLEADRASLERMVVDFVLDRGDQSHPASSADIIADRVRGGDLTPVLRAYEKDLRSPFIGTLRGDLVRALLIQVQKTKVDVEIAMSGIDALLKSQELVFGFVGLTPGLLISYASIRWFSGLLGNRRGFRMGRRQDDLRYALRNIHRILSTSVPTVEGRLSYRNHGLLICNAETLLGKAQNMLKGEDLRAFQEDIGDLANENRADKQLQIVERMAWTYSKWT
ncbi:ATP synthase regulation protein NCA2-domain-containing protein [Aspergillus cavernicola]|uniref:ATP synthase regulation protein NCA2-domain-containing protein n=1 Tax=Aspergillus cavernicola TaxID=176166 RepID=A0ABR4IX88_9EURO